MPPTAWWLDSFFQCPSTAWFPRLQQSRSPSVQTDDRSKHCSIFLLHGHARSYCRPSSRTTLNKEEHWRHKLRTLTTQKWAKDKNEQIKLSILRILGLILRIRSVFWINISMSQRNSMRKVTCHINIPQVKHEILCHFLPKDKICSAK